MGDLHQEGERPCLVATFLSFTLIFLLRAREMGGLPRRGGRLSDACVQAAGLLLPKELEGM